MTFSNDPLFLQSFNIGKGASYLRGLLDQHGGNVLTTLGGYNGMEVGATAVSRG